MTARFSGTLYMVSSSVNGLGYQVELDYSRYVAILQRDHRYYDMSSLLNTTSSR